jgi:hypothetical protein
MLVPEVNGVEMDLVICSGSQGQVSSLVNGGRQYIAFIVVGMLPDEVDPAGGTYDDRLLADIGL